ncbi:unnamed protein product [Clavelina lepadiformis]|uniref:Protein SEC13 homolog n=1 Tax=Clavelina lepadiformis TaxID=159417 RepID=A0ABP0G0X1_CLALP
MVSVINTVDTSHEDMIHDAQMDYYGLQLATCSSDRTVKIFEVKNGTQRLLTTLDGHEGPVWQVAWAHPKYGRILASCSYDRKVIIWKEHDGHWSKLYEFNDHKSSVNSLSWAPHTLGLAFACGSSDGSISVLKHMGDNQWDCQKINNAHSVGCNAVSWAPATVPGSLIEPPSNSYQNNFVRKIASAGCDNLVKIWCEKDGQWIEEDKLDGHTDWVRDCAWAPSVGLPDSKIASCSQDGRVIVWSSSGKDGVWTSKILEKFEDVVWHVSWSLTGDILAVSGGNNKVSLWKEGLNGEWTCISEIGKGQSNSNSVCD